MACNTAEYYMKNGVCTKPTTTIENCMVQGTDGKSCTTCLSTHFLTQGKDPIKPVDYEGTNYCKSTTLTNCAQLASSTSCQVCANGYKIKESTVANVTKRECTKITLTGCGLFDKEKCARCDGQRYLV
jgi:hypothetical protein